MIELGVVLLAIVGACWLFGGLIAGLFKLTFGLIGVVFAGLFSVFALGITAVLVLPVVFLALLPLLAPVLCVAALVWLIVHASRTHPEPPRPAQGQARTG